MKILSIKLKNINSLKGEQHIDFENGKLKDAGLFVITGPTGAGKSTLLDVITLALYNRIPRISGAITKKIIEEEGLVLTRNTDDCYAEVTYAVKGKAYRSHWSIRKTRNGTLSERLHELVDVQADSILTNSISQVPGENEKIIGLTYEQFVQSMLLAQGQFSKLLLAKQDERNQLLEEITGTSIYRTIGKKVFEKYRKAKDELHDMQIRMQEIKLLTAEARTEMQSNLQVLDNHFIVISKEHKILEGKIQVKKSLQACLLNMQKIVQERQTLQTQLQEFLADAERLETHERFVVHKEAWSELKRKQNSFETLRASSVAEHDKLHIVVNEISEFFKNIERFIQEPISEETFATKLSHFKKKLNQLFEREKDVQSQIETVKTRLKDQMHFLKSHQIALAPSQFEQDVHAFHKELSNFKTTFGCSTPQEVQNKKSEVNAQKNQLTEAIQKQQTYLRLLKEIQDEKQTEQQTSERIQKAKTDVQQDMTELHALNPAIEKKETELNEIKTRLGLAHYRNALQEGEPCPLCGSTAHPFAEHIPNLEFKILESELAHLKIQRDGCSKSIIQHEEYIKVADALLLKTKETIQNKEIEQKDVFESLIQLLIPLGFSEKDVQADLTMKKLAFETLAEQLNALERLLLCETQVNEALAAFQSGISLKQALIVVETERIQWFNGTKEHFEETITAHQRRFDQLILTRSNISSRIQEIENQIKELKNQIETDTTHLQNQLAHLGMQNISALATVLLDDASVKKIREMQKTLEQQKTSLDTRFDLLEKERHALEAADDTQVELGALVTKLEQLEKQRNELLQSVGSLKTELQADAEKQKDFAAKKATFDQLQSIFELWRKMNEMIGDAMGKKFSNFVQELTLKQLISYGNQRLENFSDRYLMDIDAQSGMIKVIDTYMGNAQRAVTSLSGGETFKLSLALAFGLSDLASQNVVIESLFIDEGFGTLDPESLDQAITILEHMQNTTNKSIGIISHVGELKERIHSKIKLERVGAGYSKIVVET